MSTRRRQFLVIGSIAFLAIAIVGVTWQVVTGFLNSGENGQPRQVEFVIQPDESVDSIATRLYSAGLVRSPAYFRFRVRLTNAAPQIFAGRYRLNTGMSTSQIINTITSREAAVAQEVTVRFIEGWRTEQFAEALVAAKLVPSVEAFMTATEDPKWNDTFSFLHTRPSGVALEGYLFPETYNFRQDATVDEIIQTLLRTFEERAAPQLLAAADARGMTLHQLVTVASIVEREAALPQERATIASVYYNRLAIPMPLQADPTVQYQIGTSGNWWPTLTASDLQQDGRYNTYLNPGLPPGPISNPGLASIEAALNPAQTDFLYFVAKGDGSHAFARTLQEQEQNVRRYQSQP